METKNRRLSLTVDLLWYQTLPWQQTVVLC